MGKNHNESSSSPERVLPKLYSNKLIQIGVKSRSGSPKKKHKSKHDRKKKDRR